MNVPDILNIILDYSNLRDQLSLLSTCQTFHQTPYGITHEMAYEHAEQYEQTARFVNIRLENVHTFVLWQNIQILHIENYDDVMPCAFPSRLIQLTMIEYNHKFDQPLPFNFPWPSHLRKLKLYRYNLPFQFDLPNTIVSLTLEEVNHPIQHWPSSLINMILPCYNHVIREWPPCIQYLEMHDYTCSLPDTWPNTLTQIMLPNYNGVIPKSWPISIIEVRMPELYYYIPG